MVRFLTIPATSVNWSSKEFDLVPLHEGHELEGGLLEGVHVLPVPNELQEDGEGDEDGEERQAYRYAFECRAPKERRRAFLVGAIEQGEVRGLGPIQRSQEGRDIVVALRRLAKQAAGHDRRQRGETPGRSRSSRGGAERRACAMTGEAVVAE